MAKTYFVTATDTDAGKTLITSGLLALARESGFSLGMALATTAGIWGLPGQVALAELHVAGVGALFAILASSLDFRKVTSLLVSSVN